MSFDYPEHITELIAANIRLNRKREREADIQYLAEQRLIDPSFVMPIIQGTEVNDNPYYVNGPARMALGLPPLYPTFK